MKPRKNTAASLHEKLILIRRQITKPIRIWLLMKRLIRIHVTRRKTKKRHQKASSGVMSATVALPMEGKRSSSAGSAKKALPRHPTYASMAKLFMERIYIHVIRVVKAIPLQANGAGM